MKNAKQPPIAMNLRPKTGTCGAQHSGGCGCHSEMEHRGESVSTVSKPSPARNNRALRRQNKRVYESALRRRLRQLSALEMRSTFFERHEVLDRNGQVVQRVQHGDPFVFREDFGQVPVDPTYPYLVDGSAVCVTTLGYSDAQGRWHRVVRYQRLAGPGVEALRPAQGPGHQLPSAKDRARSLSRLFQAQGSDLSVSILIKDQEPSHQLPPRAITGLAFTEHHRTDTLTPLRRKLRAENRQRREREAASLKSWIRSVGGFIGHHATLYGSVLSARIPRAHVEALLNREEVLKVELRSTGSTGESLSRTYLCHSLPSRWDGSRDTDASSCDPGTTSTPDAYLDAVNAASGALEYVDAGYDGLISGGNATWSHVPYSVVKNTTLAYGHQDWTIMAVNHPAFLWVKRSRFHYMIDSDPDSGLRVYDEVSIAAHAIPSPTDLPDSDPTDLIVPDYAHATRCAAVAMARPYVYAEPTFDKDAARGARSGVARMVSGLAAIRKVSVAEMLDVIHNGDLGESSATTYEGIDVISSSRRQNHGDEHEGVGRDGGTVACPTEDDVRGLDENSRAIVYAFSNDSVVFTSSHPKSNYPASHL